MDLLSDEWRQRVSAGQPCDPYLVWAGMTNFWASADALSEEQRNRRGEPYIPLLLDLGADASSRKERVPSLRDALRGRTEDPPLVLYRRDDQRQRFIGVAARKSFLNIWLDLLGELGIAAQLGAPRSPRENPYLDTQSIRDPSKYIADVRPLHVARSSNTERAILGKSSTSALQPRQRDARTGRGLEPPLVGIVDDGFPVGSEALPASTSGVRLLGLWHQAADIASRDKQPHLVGRRGRATVFGFTKVTTGTTHSAGKASPQFLYGAELRANNLMHKHKGPTFYQETNYCVPLRQARHGFQIASVVAADRDPMSRVRNEASTPAPSDLVAVHLPARSVLDTSGGSLASHVIDGIYYCLAHATPGQNVVVNLSYGTQAGPHDGTSMLERAFVHLLDTYNGQGGLPCLHLVLAAGNSHEAECHSDGVLYGKGLPDNSKTLHFKLPPDDATPSFIEVYFPKDSKVRVSLTPPGHTLPALQATVGEAATYSPSGWDGRGPQLSAAIVFPKVPVQSTLQQLALCALAPTRVAELKDELDQPANMLAASGVWQLTLQNEGQTTSFHAWIERDDVAPGRRQGGRQTRFLNTENGPTPSSTLSGIATFWHPRAYVVGAATNSSQRISDYSAAGPAILVEKRVEGPDVVVPIDTGLTVPGVRCGGATRGVGVRASGTSIAAAAYTRLLADWLARNGGRAERPDALIGTAPSATPPPIETLGYKEHAQAFLRGEYRRVPW
jgi:hypothetical protein